MSRKKNKQKEPDKPVLEQEKISIQDDPYWRVSSLHLDMQRLGRSLKKFEHFADEFPEWTEALLEGIPTWYCVLGVHRELRKKRLKKLIRKNHNFHILQHFLLKKLIMS